MKDDKGNLILVTLFESYLSKYLVEHPEYFIDVYQKILGFIQKVEELNQDNPAFDRAMYCLFSALKYDFPHKSIAELREQFDLIAVNGFLKLFCDYILNNKQFELKFPVQPEELMNDSLSNTGFFKDKSYSPVPKRRHSQILAQLRVPSLFEDGARGVIELSDADSYETRKLGITALKHTPKDLSKYFTKKYEPSQFIYTPDRSSNVGKWFTRHNLPIISGTSGSICDDLALVLSFLTLSQEEIRTLFLARAAMTVAKGHHSFFETMILLNQTGFALQSTGTLFQFYEQTLPEQIIRSESYIEFKNSPRGMSLLDGINDNLDFDAECTHLSNASIGASISM